MIFCVFQLNVKKQYVFGAIAFIWIVFPALETSFAAATTDIIHGTCMRFAVYETYAMKKTTGFFTVFVSYLLPLLVMIFCYARIIRALRAKVILSS